MTGEIRVHVVFHGANRNLRLRYLDPVTGRHVAKTAGTRNKRDAERAAAVWESELRAGTATAAGGISWQGFRDAYRERHLSGVARTTLLKAESALDDFTDIINPQRLRTIDRQRLSLFVAKLRERGMPETTIRGLLGHVRAGLRWAKSEGMLGVVPEMPKLPRIPKVQLMKGRPLTDAEFVKMRRAVSQVVPKAHVAAWQRYLDGLRLSGLRLAESLNLWWDGNDGLRIVTTHRHWAIRVPAEGEKGNRDRIMPLAPEFVEFLQRTPASQRRGKVFDLPRRKTRDVPVTQGWVSKMVSRFGEAANVLVDSRNEKYASAHDLRRTFGERWAPHVVPQVLMKLMRHESIETTLRYYVTLESDATADILWKHHLGATPGATRGKRR